MNIIINERPYRIKDGSTIAETLKEARIENQFGIAVAVNNVVIVKTEWEKHIVQKNDNILIINAISGG
ncbi:MAG: sulfur carrier protein ThiS [Lentimicrobiaceae bacterium]|nr:sulfur carrier protein ThiS [Lentimicrobiaceae bacterium]